MLHVSSKRYGVFHRSTVPIYPSDLTDNEWRLLKELIDKHGAQPERGGRPRIYELRSVVNAILYVNKMACQWRQLPKESPPWDTVYGYLRCWHLGAGAAVVG